MSETVCNPEWSTINILYKLSICCILHWVSIYCSSVRLIVYMSLGMVHTIGGGDPRSNLRLLTRLQKTDKRRVHQLNGSHSFIKVPRLLIPDYLDPPSLYSWNPLSVCNQSQTRGGV